MDLVGQPRPRLFYEGGSMSTPQLLDAAGRRRSPATLPGFHAGRSPRNKGFRYPPDPPRVEEIVAVMRRAGETDHGLRLRALIVVLWRAGLRIGEAMALTEPDLDPGCGSLLVRQGKGGKRREVGMDYWGFDQLLPWLARRVEMPVGTLFCVIDGQTRAADPGPLPPPATTCVASRPRPACAAASLLTSYATRTQSRWPAKVSR
jgi:hypothetical protein